MSYPFATNSSNRTYTRGSGSYRTPTWSGKRDTRTDAERAGMPGGTAPRSPIFGKNEGRGANYISDPHTGETFLRYKTSGGGSLPGGSPSGGSPSGSRGGGSRRYGGWGGGGGGGGAAKPDPAALMALLNSIRPKKFKYTALDLPEYNAPEFYDFDESRYDQMRKQIAEALAADQAAGNAGIDEALAQINDLPVAFSRGAQTSNPGMSQAMERMLSAQGVPLSINDQTMREGVQADQAFGNLMAIMNQNALQARQADIRALEGDRRRMSESLAAQGRGMDVATMMAEANARRQWERDKWQYGVEVANRNYDIRMQEAIANHQGRNQAAQANTQTANEFNSQAMSDMLDLLAQGVKIDPKAFNQAKA